MVLSPADQSNYLFKDPLIGLHWKLGFQCILPGIFPALSSVPLP